MHGFVEPTGSVAQLGVLCDMLLRPDAEVRRQAMIGIIGAVADREQSIREGAAKSFAMFLEKSDSQIAIIKLLMEYGLRNPKWQTRLHTLLALQHIDIDKLTVLQNLLEEGIAPCLQDPQELVIQAAKQTLTHWETKDLTKESTPETRDLVYGCVAVDVIERLESPNWQTRSSALEQFHQHLTSVSLPLPDPVKNSVRDVLEKLSSLLKDNNFKMTLTTLYVIGDVIELWRDSVIPVVGAVLQGLFDRLGDNKIVIRRTSIKVLYKIFQQAVSLQQVNVPTRVDSSDLSGYVPRLLQSICSALSERSSNRTEFVSVLIMAVHVLHQSRCPYDHKMVAQSLMDVARDSKDTASPFAIEALGSLRAKLGPSKIPEMQELLADRLTKLPQWGWPTVTSEGLVEYLFVPALADKGGRQIFDAEADWSLLNLPEDADPAQRPCTAVHSVAVDCKSGRLTVSTSSSSLHPRHLGSGASSSSSDTCRRSSLSSSSKKVRGGRAVRVNFADEEVMSVNSCAKTPPFYPTLTSRHDAEPLESDRALFGSRTQSAWTMRSTQRLNGHLELTPELDVPYVPSGMQRPATRQINSRKPSKEAFWEQFADDEDKDDVAREDGRALQCRLDEKNECPVMDCAISEVSVSPPSRRYQMHSERPPSPQNWIAGETHVPHPTSDIGPAKGRIFHSLKVATEPLDPSPLDISDKLRLLKTSRASSRSNCHSVCSSVSTGRRNSERLPSRPASTNDFDCMRNVDVSQHTDIRECLHSAPPQAARGHYTKRNVPPRIRGVSPSCASSAQKASDASLYTSFDNLQPFKKQILDPEEIKDMFRRLADASNWQAQFDALDSLRRLAKFHPSNELCRTDKGKGSNDNIRFQHAFPYIVQLCDSPRSSLAKNAIVALHDLYLLLPSRCVESSVDLAMPMLLRKSVDTNGFVCGEALQCLKQMSTHISVQKLLPAMLTHQQAAKVAAARSKGLLFFCWILLRVGDINDLTRYRDAPRLFNLVYTSLEHANGEVRQMARLVVQCLCNISTETDGLSEVIRPTLTNQAFSIMQQCALQPQMKVPLW